MPLRAGIDAADIEGRKALASLRSASLEALEPHPQQFGPEAGVEAIEIEAVFAEGEGVCAPLAQVQ